MATNVPSPRASRLWVPAVWFGIGLFDATQNVFVMRSEGMHHAWTALFVTLFLAWLPWALATPAVLRLGRMYPPVRLTSASMWLAHLAVCGAIAVAAAAWVAGLERLMNPWAHSAGPGGFLSLWTDRTYSTVLQSVFVYVGILAVRYGLDSRNQLAERRIEAAVLNEQVTSAQLDAFEPYRDLRRANYVSQATAAFS